ncbi:MAG: aldo/keto reductase [Bacteroidetes bacterium]|nr:aldo/keto reductase [Bacteroidota bacterium]
MPNKQAYTKLSNGIEMPMMGLGVYDMYNQEAEQAVLDALAIGYRLIDTAAMYKNETEIGNAVRKSGLSRNELFITTKLNNTEHGFDSTLKAFDESLKKINVDYIDLYLVHWPIKGKRKDSWLALEKLYKEKRVRAIGVANYLIPFLEELSTYSSIIPVLNQVEFTPWLFQKELLEYCQKNKIQLQSYSPITRGKKFNDPRLVSLCKKYDKTPAQIILRWNIEHGISAIPKSSKKERLKENFDVFDFTLSKEDIAFMDSFNENFRICDNPMEML